jgi:sugar fermentation stimulation protein A
VEAIENQTIVELLGYDALRTEVKYGRENSRIDILLEDNEKPSCYVEVKSVTLFDEQETSTEGQGFFPDSVTTRGQKHLRELTEMAESGNRAVLLFTVLHSGIEKVSAAHHIDAKYSLLLKQAQDAGVEVLCYKAELSSTQIQLRQAVEFTNS